MSSTKQEQQSDRMLGYIQALIATAYKIGRARGYEAGLRDARQQSKEG